MNPRVDIVSIVLSEEEEDTEKSSLSNEDVDISMLLHEEASEREDYHSPTSPISDQDPTEDVHDPLLQNDTQVQYHSPTTSTRTVHNPQAPSARSAMEENDDDEEDPPLISLPMPNYERTFKTQILKPIQTILNLGEDDGAGNNYPSTHEVLIEIRWKLFPVLNAIFYELKKILFGDSIIPQGRAAAVVPELASLVLQAPGLFEGRMDDDDELITEEEAMASASCAGFADPESEEITKRKLLPQLIKSLLKLGYERSSATLQGYPTMMASTTCTYVPGGQQYRNPMVGVGPQLPPPGAAATSRNPYLDYEDEDDDSMEGFLNVSAEDGVACILLDFMGMMGDSLSLVQWKTKSISSNTDHDMDDEGQDEKTHLHVDQPIIPWPNILDVLGEELLLSTLRILSFDACSSGYNHWLLSMRSTIDKADGDVSILDVVKRQLPPFYRSHFSRDDGTTMNDAESVEGEVDTVEEYLSSPLRTDEWRQYYSLHYPGTIEVERSKSHVPKVKTDHSKYFVGKFTC